MVKINLNKKDIQYKSLCFCKKTTHIDLLELICQELYFKMLETCSTAQKMNFCI